MDVSVAIPQELSVAQISEEQHTQGGYSDRKQWPGSFGEHVEQWDWKRGPCLGEWLIRSLPCTKCLPTEYLLSFRLYSPKS